MARTYYQNKKPRLLLLAANWSSYVKTEEFFFKALNEFFEIVPYGPGYTPLNEIQDRLEDIFLEKGPFDLVMVDRLLYFNSLSEHFYSIIGNKLKFNFDIGKYFDINRRFPIGLEDCPVPLFVSMLILDYYLCPKHYIELAEKRTNHFFISMGDRDFILPLSELPNAKDELFYSKATDRYSHFLKRNVNRIIPFLHFVDESEFVCFNKNKKNDWCIPGSKYYFRKLIMDKLSLYNIKYVSSTLIIQILQVLEKAGLLQLYRHHATIKIYYREFQKMINSSWFTFTCGSGLMWPIRKYFEIPAFGSLLVCVPCSSFEKMGFVDGVNCVTIDLSDNNNFLSKIPNKESASVMIQKGQRLVRDKHTAQVRARQFKNIYELIKEEMVEYVFWKGGDLYCKTKDDNIVQL